MKCTFCDKEIEKGKGKIHVKKDGTSYFYCSAKCEKNHLKLGRDPKKVKWTEKEAQ
ncbi:MAG: 50S ribosomal protein L24e [Candidatus Aenigmatarchaeota archaeon]